MDNNSNFNSGFKESDMHLLLKKISFHILFSLLVLPSFAQYTEDFTRYSVKDGLSDNGISSIQQDEHGYLWIGTDAGLNRFDGNTFKKIYQSTLPLQLASASISRLKRFGKHHLGILTKAGFQLLNTSDYTVQNFVIPDSTAFKIHLNAAWDAIELPGKSYALTTAAGFYVFDKDGHVKLRYDAFNKNDIGRKRMLYGRNFFKMPDNTYLIYIQEDGLALYDDKNKSYKQLDTSNKKWNLFLRSPQNPENYWVLKHQLSPKEYLFIPVRENVIIYYNHGLQKIIKSPLPFHLSDSLSWESKVEMLNDSVFVVNDRTNGFYYFRFNRKTGKIYTDGRKFLPDYKIICMFTDKDKRLWAGTTQGLLKQEMYSPLISAFRYQPADGKKYTGGFMTVYCHKNKIYAGRFSTNKGMSIINASTMQLIKDVDFFGNNTSWNEVHSIEMYHPDTLWIGTNMGMIWYDTKSDNYGKLLDEKKYPWSKYFSAVLAPPRDDGYAWLCSVLDGKVARYHLSSRTFTVFTPHTMPALPFEKVKRIVYDSYGDVWISGHSLARWNNRKQVFDTLISTYGGPNKFNDNIVTISSDDRGSLWIHSAYNGLLEYKIKEKTFVSYSMKDGLPSDLLHSISPVIDNKLWVAGNNHISLFDARTRKFIMYDNDDGLPEHKPTGRIIYHDKETGQLYLCSNDHLVRFPFLPEKKMDFSSNLIIEDLTVENKHSFYLPSEKINISHNENNLTLNYTVIDFEKSNYHFSYRLNNMGNWNAIGNQRSISLSNLAPGNYSLQLRASGKPGIEKTKDLFFVIHPPFWKTGWFISLVLISIIAGTYFIYRNRVRYIRQRANIDKQLSQTEMKALQAQMNPHFIFNSLNSIREMILNNENKDASHYLSKFAHLIRITLDQSSQSLVSLRNTTDYLERYMEMENIRNNLFTHEITIDENLDPDETLVPPMLIQPFIENAVWHGISASRKDIHVAIHFKKVGTTLVCKIDDNGIGINQAQKNKPENGIRHQSVGIANIQNRLNLLNEKYNLGGHISIIDKKEVNGGTEKGTLVTLHFPLEIKET